MGVRGIAQEPPPGQQRPLDGDPHRAFLRWGVAEGSRNSESGGSRGQPAERQARGGGSVGSIAIGRTAQCLQGGGNGGVGAPGAGGCVIHRRGEGIVHFSAVEGRTGVAWTLSPPCTEATWATLLEGAGERAEYPDGKTKVGPARRASILGERRRASRGIGRWWGRPHKGGTCKRRRMSRSCRHKPDGGSTSTANLAGLAPFFGRGRQSKREGPAAEALGQPRCRSHPPSAATGASRGGPPRRRRRLKQTRNLELPLARRSQEA